MLGRALCARQSSYYRNTKKSVPCNSTRLLRGALRCLFLTLLPDFLAFRQHHQRIIRRIVQFARVTGKSGNLHVVPYRLFPATYRPAHFSPAVCVATIKYRLGFRGKQGISHRVKSLTAFYLAQSGRKL